MTVRVPRGLSGQRRSPLQLHCQPQRTRSHVQPRQMASMKPDLRAQFLASFEAAPDKVHWCLSEHQLGACRINVMKDRVETLDQKFKALMEEKRRLEAFFNGELDMMRSAARLWRMRGAPTMLASALDSVAAKTPT